jgi:hypothetical protein
MDIFQKSHLLMNSARAIYHTELGPTYKDVFFDCASNGISQVVKKLRRLGSILNLLSRDFGLDLRQYVTVYMKILKTLVHQFCCI